MVRRVRRTRRVVDEQRPVGRDRLLLVDVADRLVGQRIVERVAALHALRHDHLDAVVVAVEGRRPLVGLRRHEAVEVVETLQRRPAVKRAGDARFPVGHVVVLADPERAVAVLAQDLRDGRRALRDLAGVAGVRGAHLGDHAGAHRVVVAPGDQRGAGRRAQRRGVEARVAQPHVGDAVEARRGDLPAERAPRAIARVVDQHQQHVRRAGGRLDERELVGRGILVGAADVPLERGIRPRQHGLGIRTRCSQCPARKQGSHYGQRSGGVQPGRRRCHGSGSSRLGGSRRGGALPAIVGRATHARIGGYAAARPRGLATVWPVTA